MGNVIYKLSRWLVWFGGFILIMLAIMSTASIIGRALSGFGLGPIPGDFELVEVGTALVIFCFLPWSYLRDGHATVDLLWNVYPQPMRKALLILGDLLMLIIWVLLIWRMGVGAMAYYETGETTFILQFPVWWGYAVSLIPGVIGCIAYAVKLLERLGLVSPDEALTRAMG